MRRREFIAFLGGAAVWPLAARARGGGGAGSVVVGDVASPPSLAEIRRDVPPARTS